jgi:succinoglycan biosynthesis protein ExoW
MSATLNPAPRVAVVIPYFQRSPGLLRACVESALRQQVAAELQVIVVDDASPLPAREELAELLASEPRIRLIEQANAGPGAARNRGLDALGAETDIVAFIDSDDAWEPGYLAAALCAFEAGCEMFFANSRRYGQPDTRFEWSAKSRYQLRGAEHEPLAAAGVHAYRGDFFDFAVHRSGIISTSTLAYSYRKHPGLRFNTALFNGQDRYFKLELSSVAARVGFGTAVGATEGQGVNIFDSSGWGSEKGLKLLNSYIGLAKLILASLPLDAPQRRHVQGQLAASRLDLVSSVLHLLRQKKRVDWALLGRTLRADPTSLALLPANLWRIVARRGRAQQGEQT